MLQYNAENRATKLEPIHITLLIMYFPATRNVRVFYLPLNFKKEPLSLSRAGVTGYDR